MSELYVCDNCGHCQNFNSCKKCGELFAPMEEITNQLAALQEALALLDKGYETGRNPDRESDEPAAVYRVDGSVNDKEYTLVATGKTTVEALAALLQGNTKQTIACRRCYGTGTLYSPIKYENAPTIICPECKGKKETTLLEGGE